MTITQKNKDVVISATKNELIELARFVLNCVESDSCTIWRNALDQNLHLTVNCEDLKHGR